MVTAVTSLGRSGLYDWLVQRATAVVLLAYVIFMLGYLMFNPGIDYTEWKAFFEQTCVRIFSLLALLSICLHAWIGLWSVSNDYITVRMMGPKATVLRLIFQSACGLLNFVYLVWGIQVLWSV